MGNLFDPHGDGGGGKGKGRNVHLRMEPRLEAEEAMGDDNDPSLTKRKRKRNRNRNRKRKKKLAKIARTERSTSSSPNRERERDIDTETERERDTERERERTEEEVEKQQKKPPPPPQPQQKKKQLVVLDINGDLVDAYCVIKNSPRRAFDKRVGRFRVYKRPFCDEFVKFCLDNFLVGIWSSARRHNVDNFTQYIFGQDKAKLAFIWNQEHCTDTGMKDPENKHKPLFLKELPKLWGKSDPNLPWQIGEYGPTNTLLIDDTPYKALRNPPNSAIFPAPYDANNSNDNLLGSVFLSYLKGVMQCEDVRQYVESNPFGQPMLTSTSPHWSYFSGLLSDQPKKATMHYFAD